MKKLLFSLLLLTLLPNSSLSDDSRIDRCNPGGPLLESISGTVGDVADPVGGEEAGSISLIAAAPKIVLDFSCPVNPKTFLEKAAFVVPGIAQGIKVNLVEGEERGRVLQATGEDSSLSKLVVTPKLNLPADTKVRFVIAKGLSSSSGFRTSEDIVRDFLVEPEFRVSTKCDHTFADSSCDPYLGIYAVFSRESLAETWQISLKDPSGSLVSPIRSSWSERGRVYPAFKFKGPFRAKTEYSLVVSPGIRDKQGNPLSAEDREIEIPVKFGQIPPMVKFGASFGVLELNGANALPLTIRNIDGDLGAGNPGIQSPEGPGANFATVRSESTVPGILGWLSKINKVHEKIESNFTSIFEGNDDGLSRVEIPKISGGSNFEVVGIPFSKPGFYVVEVESPNMGSKLVGADRKLYVPTSVLVTDLAVHFKQGRDSSLAWVTQLSTGLPVVDALISINDCKGGEIWSGRSDQSGIALIPSLNLRAVDVRCEREYAYPDQSHFRSVDLNNEELVVVARKGEDMTFALSSWDQGIEPWRFNIATAWNADRSPDLWTVFDRTLLRQGETVHGKAIVRSKTERGIELFETTKFGPVVQFVHGGSQDKFEQPIVWSDSAGNFEWKIPADAKLGDYSVYYIAGDKSYFGGAFSVENYKVPLTRGAILAPNDRDIFPPVVPIDLNVRYLNGGGVSLLPIRLRYSVAPSSFSFPETFPGFDFSQEPAPESYSNEESETVSALSPSVLDKSTTLDAQGAAHIDLDNVPTVKEPSKLNLEMEYRDPNGEIQSVSSSLPLLPSKYLVGLKLNEWATKGDQLSFDIAVVNSVGIGQRGVLAEANLYQREIYTHRKRLVGGTYGYENLTVDQRPVPICSGMSNVAGVVSCHVRAQVAGQYVLEAIVRDVDGRLSRAARSVTVGSSDLWFSQSDSDRIDLLSEKDSYEVGETAKIQVRTPFKDATALITVEREGVIEHFVQAISRSNPEIQLKVRESWAPNVFVSVLTTRGRLGDRKATATFDPAKPAFRIGNVGIKVGLNANRLNVTLSTDKEVYQVRDQVHAKVKLTREAGLPIKAGSKVAVAVVDEGLLQLKPNLSWGLLEGIMDLRPLFIRTFTSQGYVIGKRHFGLKALPFGGGGGKITTRELFDTLIFWNPDLALDAAGEGVFTFRLNDSLSSFKVVGVATSGNDLFGTGETLIRATKDLMLFSGVPELVRTGDRYTGEFTVRNATKSKIDAKVGVIVKEGAANGHALEPSSLELQPEESRVAKWDIQVPQTISFLEYKPELLVGGVVRDSLLKKQVVEPSVPLSARASDNFILRKEERLNIKPVGRNTKDELRVSISPSIRVGLSGAVDYMSKYPYGCLEQRTSRAVATEDYVAFNSILSDLPTYLDSDGLAKFYPSSTRGDLVLTAYILAIAKIAGVEVPESARYRMLQGLRDFSEGRKRLPVNNWADDWFGATGWKRGDGLPYSELDRIYRVVIALSALSRYEEVKVGVLASLLHPFDKLPTAVLVPLAQLINNSPNLPLQQKRLEEIAAELKTRVALREGLLTLSKDRVAAPYWYMGSEDQIAAQFVELLVDVEQVRNRLGLKVESLLIGLISRQASGHWDSTVANAISSALIRREANKFEEKKIEGETVLTVDGAETRFDWSKDDSFAHQVMLSQASDVVLSHKGGGAPWISILHLAAVPVESEISNGIKLRRKIEAVQAKEPGIFSVQDIWKVTISLESPGPLPGVVLEDPVPPGAVIFGGLSPVASAIDLSVGPSASYPVYEERTFSKYRAYFDLLNGGESVVSYTFRLNTAGEFNLPQTRAEVMYRPTVFGELPISRVVVKP